jgi:hypothetical protein
MIWQIQGNREGDGQPIAFDVEALDQREALAIAKGQGVFVSSIIPRQQMPGQYPQGQVPAGQYTQAYPQYPQGQVPAGQVPIGQMPTMGYAPYPTPGYQIGPNYGKRSLVLGIIGLFAWLLPIAGFPVTIIGLVYGLKASKTDRPSPGGVAMNIIGLVLSTINAAMGAYLAVHGKI